MNLLEQNFWSKYGFKNNPYDTNALTLYSDALLPISEAYVGRGEDSREFQLITNIFSGVGGNRFIVEGEIGLGKTTFVNYHRYVWEHESKDPLFTSLGEITFSLQWTRADFLQEMISHLTTKLYLIHGNTLPVNNELYQELLVLNKVFVEETHHWQLQAFGLGLGGGKEKQVLVPSIPEAKLYNYFRELIRTILQLGFKGIILHLDNMELMQQEGVLETQRVFEEIRDILQVPYVYYVFVGRTGFFSQVISPLERVRSIFFSWPIHLKPLTEKEVLKVIELRYELLSSQGRKYIPPVENELISYLYQLYQGRIRFVMDAVHGILANFPISYPQTLPTRKAKELLKSLTIEKIRSILTEKELQVLLEMTQKDEFTNMELAKSLGLQRQNVAKYIKKLHETGYILFQRKEGNKLFYRVTDEICYLNIMVSNQKNSSFAPSSTSNNLNFRQKQFVQQLQKYSTITTAKYVQLFQISSPTALKDLNDLVQKEYLIKHGKKRGAYFEVNKVID